MNTPITGFTAIMIALLIALFLAVVLILVSILLGPKRPHRTKGMPYESGMNPVGTTKQRFGVHYYLVAMLFIIFDIETIFLYPWALILRSDLQVFGLIEMGIFFAILGIGYIYVLGKRALEWD